MKLKNKLMMGLASIALFGMVLVSTAQAADATGQKVVVTIKQDIFTDDGYESACIGIQLASMYLSIGAEVSLFPTLDGVAMSNNTQLFYAEVNASDIGHWTCNTMNGPRTLTQVITGFVAAGGDMVICPVCWNARYGAENVDYVDGAVKGNPTLIPELFGNATRLLDF